MRRGITVAILAALLVLAVPLGTVAAKSTGGGNGKPGKITICHKPQGVRPVTITIANSALKAHKAHGDTEGPCPTQPKPAAPKVCTFDAATSAYYAGSNATAPLFATGPIRFSWTVSTGSVNSPGGYWNELSPPPPAASVTYYNNVTAGTVSAAGAVSLSFTRTVPDVNTFTFAGSLSALTGASTMSGLMAGNWFTATGTVGCTDQAVAPKVCTFDAATSAYHLGANASAPLYATGPIRFSWTIATGTVKVPGGYWNEALVTAPTVIYYNNVTAGSVSAGGSVSLSLVRTVPDANSFGFSGALSATTGSSTLSGVMAGYWFTATGTVACNGS